MDIITQFILSVVFGFILALPAVAFINFIRVKRDSAEPSEDGDEVEKT